MQYLTPVEVVAVSELRGREIPLSLLKRHEPSFSSARMISIAHAESGVGRPQMPKTDGAIGAPRSHFENAPSDTV